MIYLMIAVILTWLAFDAFSETIVDGTPFIKAFKVKWSDRLLNAQFNKLLNNYNALIEKKGESYSLRKELFAYLDYDEYVTLTLYKKNTVIALEYSITNDEVKISNINLKELNIKDRYYGRWINGYYKQLESAQIFNGDYISKVDGLISLAVETAIKSDEKNNKLWEKYHNEKLLNPTDYRSIIELKRKELILRLEKEIVNLKLIAK